MDKFNWLKKYTGILMIVLISIVFYKIFDNLWSIVEFFKSALLALSPLLIGAILAYFLSPLAISLEKRMAKINGVKNHKRLLSVMVVFLTFIAFIAILGVIIFPLLADAIVDLTETLTLYIENFEENIRKVSNNETIVNYILSLEDDVEKFIQRLAQIDPVLYVQSIFSAASLVFSTILGIIFCPYILIERNRLADLFDCIVGMVISKKTLNVIHSYAYKSHIIFGNFVYGKFIDSVIIGVIAGIGFWLLGLPVFPLLAVIIFITNMIPYFGPFIGAVPVISFVLLTGDFALAFWTALFILALQQFDGLILGPAILGESVGITPFWVITAITLFGGLWGFVGMFIGVPLICIIRMLFHDYLDYRKRNIKSDA